jgi:hypothetical protein
MADHADARKEIDLVRAAVVQIGQLLLKSPKMNGNGAKWKKLAYRPETEKNSFCKPVGVQELFADMLHPYAAVYKEMWDSVHRAARLGTGRYIAT